MHFNKNIHITFIYNKFCLNMERNKNVKFKRKIRTKLKTNNEY